MPPCDRFERDFLPEWDPSRAAADAHIATCQDCREHGRVYAKLIAALRGADAPALSQDWQARVFAAVRAREATSADRPQADPAATPPPAAARVTRSLRAVSVLVPLAAAAALWLLFWPRGHDTQEPLPEYVASVAGGERLARGGDTKEAVFRSGSRLELTLQPAHAVEGELGARTFLTRARSVVELSMQLERLPKGVIRLRGAVPNVLDENTTLDIVVVVARPDWLSQHAREAALGSVHLDEYRTVHLALHVAR